MAKRTPTSLADLSQDIAGTIPIGLIQAWATSPKTAASHAKLLQPYLCTGTVVCSDSSGLSNLSQKLSTFETLKLVNLPKEIIFKHGSAIGGRAIGTWAADNTEMFYPQTVHPQDVLSAMRLAQADIGAHPVKVGMCLHVGQFYDIGGGLYGPDADFVEDMAESQAKSGEILITPAAQKILGQTYPLPFNADFYESLKKDNLPPAQYISTQYVLVTKTNLPEHKLLLDVLTGATLANQTLLDQLESYPHIQRIKSNGMLGIFTSPDLDPLLDYARSLIRLDTTFAIAHGEVFVFPLGDAFEIAGSPVNIASKLAEDLGEAHHIYIDSSVASPVNGTPFTHTISSVTLTGVCI